MTQSQKRLRFDKADVGIEGPDTCRVEVTFSFGDRVIVTSATAGDDEAGRLKAAAEAALRAVEQAVGGRIRCHLADLDHVNALGKDLIAVLVDVQFEGKEVQLFGSCQVQDSDLATSVKAALNATNRIVELVMR
ncbi:MAG TPA: hypothetical protein VG778_04395 [Blastocatellia bacterium]|jgi:hypothetical protein|nr:hypothetical protein [Blastocatellia bacterium]